MSFFFKMAQVPQMLNMINEVKQKFKDATLRGLYIQCVLARE